MDIGHSLTTHGQRTVNGQKGIVEPVEHLPSGKELGLESNRSLWVTRWDGNRDRMLWGN